MSLFDNGLVFGQIMLVLSAPFSYLWGRAQSIFSTSLKKTLAFFRKSDYLYSVSVPDRDREPLPRESGIGTPSRKNGDRTMTALLFTLLVGYWWYWRKDISEDVCLSAGLV